MATVYLTFVDHFRAGEEANVNPGCLESFQVAVCATRELAWTISVMQYPHLLGADGEQQSSWKRHYTAMYIWSLDPSSRAMTQVYALAGHAHRQYKHCLEHGTLRGPDLFIGLSPKDCSLMDLGHLF